MDSALYPGFSAVTQGRPAILARQWLVSTTHYLASVAGERVLARGGNAIDAGVAAGLCINVLEPHLADFGGVAPIQVYLAESDTIWTVSGVGRWPQRASAAYFQAHHGGQLPEGILRSVTPAAPDAWLTALARWGTWSFADVVAPALELAASGFPVWPELHQALKATRPTWERWPGTAATYLSNGRIPAVGELLRRPDLARTFERMIAAEARVPGRVAGIQAARDLLYRGEIAQEIARFCEAEGGLLRYEDLAAFQVGIEPPEHYRYREYDVYACGFWCQGPVLLQFLNILDGIDLRQMGHNSADYLHTLAEAMNLAFADRERYYADPDFVPPPRWLLDPAYGAAQRARIRPDRAFGRMPDPAPAGPPAGPRTPDTSYLCVVDAQGNAISATPSDFGLRTPTVPGLGFTISPRGIQSWTEPDHPHAIAPGRRPRLTPNPALARKNGHLYLAFGCPGGDVQPQAMLQVFLNLVEFGMNPQLAIEQPRLATFNFPDSFYPHTYSPGLVRVERRIPEATRAELARRGHVIEAWPEWTPAAAGVCAIVIDAEHRTLAGGADPRRESAAIGW